MLMYTTLYDTLYILNVNLNALPKSEPMVSLGEILLLQAALIYTFVLFVITFYLSSCLGQESAKGPFGLRVKQLRAHLPITFSGGLTLIFLFNVSIYN